MTRDLPRTNAIKAALMSKPEPKDMTDKLLYYMEAAELYGQECAALERELQDALSVDQPINQCDGCRRGLPLHANGLHYEDKHFDVAMPIMACEKKRYIADASPTGDVKADGN